MNSWPPGPGLRHPLALRGEDPLRLTLGLSATLLAFLVAVQLVAQAVLGAGWLLRGQPDFSQYRSQALAYKLPDGLVATHLGIGSLLLVVLLIYRYWHGRQHQWVISVQPGGRWRYLLICFVVAAVVFNASLWLARGGDMAWSEPQPGWSVYLLLVLITSPLQAAAEEFFFRGYLQQTIGSLTGRSWVGIVSSALVFAVLHGGQNAALFVHRLGFGLIAGVLVWATGGLEAAIAAHVVNNVFAFTYSLFTGGIVALKAMTAISWGVALVDLVGFAVFGSIAWWLGLRLRVAILTP
ncbi:CPBP family intramembrane glutamic endopeptidase [Arachnia rubra]|uniref:CPBP family intramembrane metalloprotease n=1 Tax=Arachnia rubra TaxID=1547448 RepID=A0ABX7Y1X1_9ACTN|nr:type II CAAX endopeptidase family protein [Arachnia rubra]QUC07036.1 CPBP family intramembrane metalloprotease [Arachnia rubra]